MIFYNENHTYLWEIDRFHLFTESEKCSLLEGVKRDYEVWKSITPRDVGGIADMLEDLVKEIEESLEK